MSNWNQIHRHPLRLTNDSDAWISTLLDFYGLPEDFPGLPEALSAGDPQEKFVALQDRFAAKLDHQRFIPFLAPHEFEAWLFSAPDVVEAHFGKARLADQLRDAVRQAGAPEWIDHDADTHPKALSRSLVDVYGETSGGPVRERRVQGAR
ncbi:MAG: DUF4276 family protein [Candidatus Accumulibacter sp.]|nr:DUF4276 family protein [Accumulibacter sp.]